MDHATFGKRGNSPVCLRLFAPRIGRLSGVSRIFKDAPRRFVEQWRFGASPCTRQWPFPRRCFEQCREPRATIHRPDVAIPRRRRRGGGAGPPSTAAKADDARQAAPGDLVIRRVLDPRGNSVPGATRSWSMLRNLTPWPPPNSFLLSRFMKLIPLGDARADSWGGSASMPPGRPRHGTRISASSRSRHRLWRRLGQARPRRRSARRRDLAPAGAGDPRATVRRAGPSPCQMSGSRSGRSIATFRWPGPVFMTFPFVLVAMASTPGPETPTTTRHGPDRRPAMPRAVHRARRGPEPARGPCTSMTHGSPSRRSRSTRMTTQK